MSNTSKPTVNYDLSVCFTDAIKLIFTNPVNVISSQLSLSTNSGLLIPIKSVEFDKNVLTIHLPAGWDLSSYEEVLIDTWDAVFSTSNNRLEYSGYWVYPSDANYSQRLKLELYNPSNNPSIDSLLDNDGGYIWSSGNEATSISYSFPWFNAEEASFVDSYPESTFNGYYFGFNEEQARLTETALKQWSNIANIDFTLIQEDPLTETDGDIRIFFTDAVDEDWLGLSHTPSWSSFNISGDIHFRPEAVTDYLWEASSTSWMYKSLMHEIGHSLGLEHPFEGTLAPAGEDLHQYSIMSYTESGGEVAESGYIRTVIPTTPMVNDIQAIQYLYGANYNHNSDDTTYLYKPDNYIYETIWDGGGNDTISITDYETNCIINITSGAYSSLKYESSHSQVTYNGDNNLGIAYNCEIENVIGGKGADTIIGNSLSNYLYGGDGNDTLKGGAGNDYFDWDLDYSLGNDTFYGGLGNDGYSLNSTMDKVIEYADEGDDAIWVYFDYDMNGVSNVEWLIGYGKSGLALTANEENNYISGTIGNDQIDGGNGIDHYNISDLLRSDCIIDTAEPNSILLGSASQGADQLEGIERILFNDIDLAFDINGPTSAGGIYRLYKATFNREPDKVGLGYWIFQADIGNKDAVHMAEDFTWSEEFQTLYDIETTDNYGTGGEVEILVSGFYQNVLGRAPDTGGLNYYTNVIESREKTVGRVLAEISDSPENYNLTLDLIGQGIEYDSWIF